MATNQATFRQRMALYKFTKINNKGVDIDFDTAKGLLSRAFNGEDITADMKELTNREPSTPSAPAEPKMDIASIVDEAFRLGEEAAKEVPERLPFGFATVRIMPARGKLVTHLKKRDVGYTGRSRYDKGYNIFCRLMTQGMDKKEAWARAVADHLREHFPTYQIYVSTRLD